MPFSAGRLLCMCHRNPAPVIQCKTKPKPPHMAYFLQTLRLAWCVNISDVSVNQLALHCPLLQTLEVGTAGHNNHRGAGSNTRCSCGAWPKCPTRAYATWRSDASELPPINFLRFLYIIPPLPPLSLHLTSSRNAPHPPPPPPPPSASSISSTSATALPSAQSLSTWSACCCLTVACCTCRASSSRGTDSQ
jgi:hypothetical protein